MKSSVFWDITPWSPLEANQRFGRTFCLHLQGQRIIQVSNQREVSSACCVLQSGLLLGLFFYPEGGVAVSPDDKVFWSIFSLFSD
jgi:hypothetical protein